MNQIYESALFKVMREVTLINSHILSNKINNLLDLKKVYLGLKKQVENTVPPTLTLVIENKSLQCSVEIAKEIDKSYYNSVQIFKISCWGEFSKLNNKDFPELFAMMIGQHGNLLRSFDDFNGTLAAMDFHGYTQFSKDIKYNKTPLLEFGNVLPQKIEQICNFCKCIIYEMEGDTLIIIGPPNPVYIFNAVLCIIELCRQKPFKPGTNPKSFHGIDINNPMIKPFELNATIATGGRIFINKNGHIIGSLISEASRMLKIINTKKPNKSGILCSDKLYRKLAGYKNTQTTCHVSVFDYQFGDPFLVDVKGTRLNIREVYLEKKDYIDDTNDFSKKLSEEIKKKNTAKWQNILSYYMNLILTALNDIKCTILIGKENYSQDKIRKLLELKFYEWISNPQPSTINDILKLTTLLYNASEEIRDVTAVYHEFIQENYTFIAKKIDEFYQSSVKQEALKSAAVKRAFDSYEQEVQSIKKKFPTKRIIDTILSDEIAKNQLQDVPYMGKK